MSKDFSVSPYFDDYDKSKNFLKVLFQPGRPVQTRELNQIQSILQNQVTSVGEHLFKNGAMVIPGHVFYDNKVIALRLNNLNTGGVSSDVIVPSLVGKTIQNDNGVKANVLHYELSTGESTSFTTLFVKYTSGSDDGTQFEFNNSDVVYDVDNINLAVQLSASSASKAAIATVNDGIFYINGNFVNVARQTIVLSDSSDKPTARCGLRVDEEIITEDDDTSLFDNALGYSNQAAPGAHRYKVTLTLENRSFDYDDAETEGIEKFVDILHVKNGKVVLKINDTAYAELERIFARRTFDESGDYEVKPFDITAREYRNNNRGTWAASTVYLNGDIVEYDGVYWEAREDGISGGTALASANINQNDGNIDWVQVNAPQYNNGTSLLTTQTLAEQQASAKKVVYRVSKGKAYIKGYEVKKQDFEDIVSTKGTTADYDAQEVIPVSVGSWTQVENIAGIPNIETCEQVNIYPHTVGDFSPTTATATYTVSGGVINSITITDPGAGYTIHNPPTITAAVGSGASFRATISPSGQITDIKIVSGGTGYSAGSLTIGAPTEQPIGSCRIRSMEYSSGTIGSAAAQYVLQVFEIKVEEGYDPTIHAKSVLSSGPTGFSADISTRQILLDGTSSYTSASKDVVGVNTSYKNLVEGQTIIIEGVEYKVANIASNLGLTTTANIATTGANDVFAVFSNFRTSDALVLPMPKSYIKTLRDDAGALQTSYTVKRRFKDVTVTGNSLTLNLTAVGELFDLASVGNYIVSDQSTKNILTYTSATPSGASVTISGLSIASGTVEVLTTIKKSSSAAREKVKTLSTKVVDITSVTELNASFISMTEADIYRLIKVYKVDGEGTPVGDNYPAVGSQTLVDITNQFNFDDGQTPFSYEIGKLYRKSNAVAPNNTIRIIFEYFQHSAGDYFSVDSYVNVSQDKVNPLLRDCLDFRPRVADTGTDFLVANGASVTEPLVDSSYFICDYGYYLPRVDILTMNKSGVITLHKGKPGYGLRKPSYNEDSMKMAEITVAPGIDRVTDQTISVVKSEHRRYTMADISTLDDRIGTLEYYTQLSLLESKALTDDVVDQNGMTRFKSGILVDSFENQDVGDGFNPDFLVSIDSEQGECRAYVETDDVRFKEANETAAQRTADHYQLTGSSITLPYTETLLLAQPLASRSENINPFSVVTFNGELEIYPKSDTWVETQFEGDLPAVPGGTRTTSITQQTGRINIVWNRWAWFWNPWRRENIFVRQATNRGLTVVSTSQVSADVWGRQTFSAVLEGNLNNTWLQRLIRRGIVSATPITETITQTTPTVDQRFASFSPTTSTGTRGAQDTVIGSNVIPYARTTPISFKLEKARPKAVYSATFGEANVVDNIDMATDVVLNTITNTPLGLNYANNADVGAVGSLQRTARTVTTAKIRQYSDMPVVFEYIWERGEVVVQYVTGSSGPTSATAVVHDVHRADGKDVLKLINVKGTFDNAKSIYVIRSGAPVLVSSSIASVSTPTSKVLTDSVGSAYGVMYPPCTWAERIPSGLINFVLADSGIGNVTPSESEATFVSNGVQEIVRRAPPPPPPQQWSDPLAQTFMLNENSSIVERDAQSQESSGQGAFITSVGVYFETKDTILPVTIQLRTVENGYPSGGIMASKTIKPHQISVSTDATTETVITFNDPVFLENNKEYALVLLTDSVKYKVWIARVGENAVGVENQVIASQPTLGSLFKSQNSSTWTAEQLEDLKFNIYRAKFDISKAGAVNFVNRAVKRVMLEPNSLLAVTGSTDIRVFHKNHGLNNGDKVGVTDYTDGPFGTGLTMNNATVSAADFDSYTLAGVGNAAATYSGYFGGDTIEVNRNLQYSTIMPKINEEHFVGTDVSMFLTTMKTDYTFMEQAEVQNMTNQHYTSMMQVASYRNEQASILDADKKSLKMTVALSSSDDFFSPVINSDEVTAVVVRNRLNNPDKTVNTAFDEVEIADDISIDFDYNDTDASKSYLFVSGGDFTTYESQFDTLSVGKYISVRTPTTAPNSANISKDFLINKIVRKAGTSIKIFVEGGTMVDEAASANKNAKLVMLNRYVDELAPFDSTVFSTYVAKQMNLSIQASSIRVTVDVNKPANTFVDVYYRTGLSNSETSIDNERWYKAEPTLPIADMKDFRSFVEVTFEENNIPLFDVAQVKVVYRSDNLALTPRIKNLRIMTLA